MVRRCVHLQDAFSEVTQSDTIHHSLSPLVSRSDWQLFIFGNICHRAQLIKPLYIYWHVKHQTAVRLLCERIIKFCSVSNAAASVVCVFLANAAKHLLMYIHPFLVVTMVNLNPVQRKLFQVGDSGMTRSLFAELKMHSLEA